MLNTLAVKQFPPLAKKGGVFDVPDGMMARLTKEFGGKVYGRQVVDTTCGSSENETIGVHLDSGNW
jgi:hypothetical protein